jgi:iron complex transport system ATP-binding protein
VTLDVQQLSIAYRTTPVLHEVALGVRPGVTAILGPNAAGKSTLLRCLAGLLAPASGAALLDGRDLRRLDRDAHGRAISYLPQQTATRAVLTVFETVLLGHLQRLGWHVEAADAAAVQALLEEFELAAAADRWIDELSGGQQQMAFIAQALAREPSVLLLDEPSASLDLRHQFDLCDRIRELTRVRGLCTVLSMHDVNLAARLADTIHVLVAGRMVRSGTPAEVLTEETTASVYRVAAHVTRDAAGRVLVTPLGPLP